MAYYTPSTSAFGGGYGTYFGRNPRVTSGQPPPPSFPGGVPSGYVPGYQPTPSNWPDMSQPAPVTSAPATVSTPQRPDFSNIDYSNDPILARTRALAEEAIGQATAEARAGRTRLAIGFGDPELADKLGLGGKVRKQAEENTFGTLQELQRGLTRRNVFDINRPLSDRANLFYSTERARQLALSGEQFLRDKSTAWNTVQDKLAQIAAQQQAAKMAAQAQIISAEQEAYGRALQSALYAAGAG